MEAASSQKQHLSVSQVRSLWRSQGYKEDHNSKPKHLRSDLFQPLVPRLTAPHTFLTFHFHSLFPRPLFKCQTFLTTLKISLRQVRRHHTKLQLIYTAWRVQNLSLGFLELYFCQFNLQSISLWQIKWHPINPMVSLPFLSQLLSQPWKVKYLTYLSLS